MREGNCLVVCESIHDVIALEKAVKSAGMWCEMIPTPRAVSSDCGMSLELSESDIGAVKQLISVKQISIENIYTFSNAEFVSLKS